MPINSQMQKTNQSRSTAAAQMKTHQSQFSAAGKNIMSSGGPLKQHMNQSGLEKVAEFGNSPSYYQPSQSVDINEIIQTSMMHKQNKPRK